MFSTMKKTYYAMGASLTVGMMGLTSSSALAQGEAGSSDNNFNTIAENINNSISSLPALLSSLSYLVGLVLGVLGILKIKDHVEQPTQVPLKEGAIRLAAGGALFALPMVFEAMENTIGNGTNAPTTAKLNALEFSVN